MVAKGQKHRVVSIQLISLASRGKIYRYLRERAQAIVSIQLISLASRGKSQSWTPAKLQSSFHSINFSSE